MLVLFTALIVVYFASSALIKATGLRVVHTYAALVTAAATAQRTCEWTLRALAQQ